MQLIDIFEQSHPFNYAYPVQNANDIKALTQAYNWAASAYGSDMPMPEVLVANHEHMQRAARQANHHTVLMGQVYGWYSQQYDKIFLSDQIRPARSKKEAAVVVHEFIHYFQFHDDKPNDVEALENEADEYMMRFLQGS